MASVTFHTQVEKYKNVNSSEVVEVREDLEPEGNLIDILNNTSKHAVQMTIDDQTF